MPEPYSNPDRNPFVGSYKWNPATPKNTFGGEDYLSGFDTMIISRGEFVNFYPGSPALSSVVGTANTENGTVTDPILNAFRPLSAQDVRVSAASNNYYSLEGIFEYDFNFSQSDQYTGFEIEYDFSISLYDDGIITDYNTSGLAQTEIAQYINLIGFARTEYAGNITPNLSFIDNSRLLLGQLMYTNSGGSYQEFPPAINNVLQALAITRVRLTEDENYPNDNVSFSSQFFKILPNEEINISAFNSVNGFRIKSRDNLTSKSFIFNLRKIKFFTAARVNFRTSQLPASLMSYSFGINGTYFYTDINGNYWPQSDTPLIPNFHIKFFSPDYTSQSPGMAHSLSVWIFVISWPFFGPLENFQFPPGANLYNIIVIGPEPSLRKNVFYFNHKLATYNQNLQFESTINPNAGRSAILTKGFSDLNNVSKYDLYYVGTGGVNNPTNTNLSMNVDLNTFPKNRFELIYSGSYIGPDGKSNIVDDNIQFITIAETQQTALVESSTYSPEYIAELQPMIAYTETSTGETYSNFVRYFDNIPSEDFENLISLKPMALFIQSLDRPLANPIIIQNGLWNFYIKCNSIDASQQFDSRVFLRLWFVPEDFDFVDTNRLYEYQISNEFYFNTTVNGGSYTTNITKGTPFSSEQLFITSPLSDVSQQYVFTQYVSNSLNFNAITSSGNSRLRLVIGLYGYSVLKYPALPGQENNILVSPEYPKLSMVISPSTTRLETTISQTLSNADIIPLRDNIFGSVSEINYTSPLSLLNILVNNTVLQGKYVNYSNSLNFGTVFNKLLVLGSAGDYNPDLGITYASINLNPQTITDFKSTADSIYADFVTNAADFYEGIVNSGSWSIEADINYPDNESGNITYEVRFEGFLSDYSGNFVARIFRSPYMTSKNSVFKYDFNISFGFSAPNTDTQFVLRVYYIGYSATGSPVNSDVVAKSIAPLPLGIKIDKLIINSNTLALRHVDQDSSAGGSPSFYEDLPLITSTVDDPIWWLILSSETLSGTQSIFDNNTGFSITGVVYSATLDASQFTNNMEVKLNTILGSFDPNQRNLELGLRTAAGSTSAKSLNSSQDDRTGQTMLIGLQQSTNVNTTQDMFSFDSDSEARIDDNQKTIQGQDVEGSSNIIGSNPSVIQYKSFLVGYQNDVSTGTNYSIVKGNIDVNLFTGPNYTGQLVPANLVTSYIQNTINCVLLYDSDTNSAHILGVSGNNFLIHKEVDLVNEPLYPQVASGIIYVIEGSSGDISTLNPQVGEILLYPSDSSDLGLNGEVDGKYAAFIFDKNKYFFYAYILGSKTSLESGNVIYGRTKTNSRVSDIFEIVSVPVIFNGLNLSSSEQSIVDSLYLSSPVLLYNANLDLLSIVFWCGTATMGKIFAIYLDKNLGIQKSTFNSWILIAGSYSNNIANMTTDQKAFNSVFQKAIAAKRIILSNNFDETLTISEQKVAAYSCEYKSTQFINSFFIQYYINDQQIQEKVLMGNGTVLSHTTSIN